MGNLVSSLLGTGRTLRLHSGSTGLVLHDQTTPCGNPLPLDVHKVIKQEDLGPGRLIVIGDVHGCYNELQLLLAKLDYKLGYDNLVFVGDLVNKGPNSLEVLQHARALCSRNYCWVVRGNHDDSALASRRQFKLGMGPSKSKLQWAEHLQLEDERFLAQLPFSLEIQGYNVLVVHAGLLPGVPLRQQQLTHMYKMRDVQQQPDGGYTGVEKAIEGSQPWAAAWKGAQHVLFGHDAKRRLQRELYATGLDTGCVYGGQLTSCVLPPIAHLQRDNQFSATVAAFTTQSGRCESREANAGSRHMPTHERKEVDVPGLTLELLQAQLVVVNAADVYEKKK